MVKEILLLGTICFDMTTFGFTIDTDLQSFLSGTNEHKTHGWRHYIRKARGSLNHRPQRIQ